MRSITHALSYRLGSDVSAWSPGISVTCHVVNRWIAIATKVYNPKPSSDVMAVCNLVAIEY